ncbi:MAG: hypothetical protein Q8M17_16165 [Actinomycetota bacterium]|nr:hypothetical protein [Actinomycetota bacterium]
MSIDTVSTITTPAPLTAAEKARRAALWTLCPDWCSGLEHLENDWLEHNTTIGSVEGVSVTVVQSVGEDGQPHGCARVKVYGENFGDALDLHQAEDLQDLIRKACALVEKAGGA